MPYPSFARARRYGRQLVGSPVAVYVAGLVSAVVLALLLLAIPLLADLLTTRGSTAPPAENTWLGSAIAALYARWPEVRGNQSSLGVLIGVVWLLATGAAAALYWLESTVQSAAIETAGAVRRQIHAQAHRLGAGDLFLGQKMASTELFMHSVDRLRTAFVAWWRVFPHAVAFAVLMIGLALSVDFWLTLASLLVATLAWRLFSELRTRAKQREAQDDGRAAQLQTLLVEHLGQNRELGNLVQEDPVSSEPFEENLRRHDAVLLNRETSASGVGPLVTLFALAGTGVVLLLAGFNVLSDPPRLSLAGMVLLLAALGAMAYPLVRFERLLGRLSLADQAAAEVFDYLDREPRVGQLPDASPLEPLNRQIAFEHVSLPDAAGRPVLDDVSFSLNAVGETVLFSSEEPTPLAVAGLLARFCDPSSGRLVYDGRDLRQATLDSVRRQVTLILPEHVLINGTLAENIVGNDRRATPTEVIDVLKLVHAYEFVQPLPEGLETVIGPNGLTLSTGQAIRIGLARVALRRPSIVVIEEPRDDLSQVTAERVADALVKVTQDRALIIVARRLATLRAARRILLFHKGRLIGDGTHQELLQQNELYRHLNYVRFNEFRDTVH